MGYKYRIWSGFINEYLGRFQNTLRTVLAVLAMAMILATQLEFAITALGLPRCSLFTKGPEFQHVQRALALCTRSFDHDDDNQLESNG